MRKFFLIIIGFFLFLGFGSAALASGDTVTGKLDLKAVFNDKVQNISFQFCDGTESYFSGGMLSYTMRPAKTIPFCVQLSSKYHSGLVVKYAFVDGSLTDHGTVTCDQELSTGNSSYFPFYEDTFHFLKTKSSLKIRDRIHAPVVQTGTHYFCFTYRIDEPINTQQRYINNMFNIVVRKGIPMKLIISGDEYRYQWFDDLIWQFKNLFYSKG